MKKLLCLAFAILIARANAQDWTNGWHPDAYPTREHYQQPVVRLTLSAVENAIVLTNWSSCSNSVVLTNSFLSDLRPMATETAVVNTWRYALTNYVESWIGTNYTCTAVPVSYAATVTGRPAPTELILYVKDVWALDDYRARVERWRALSTANTESNLVPKPRFYRWNRDALVEAKAWWLGVATSYFNFGRTYFVDQSVMMDGTLDAWFATPQTWTWTTNGWQKIPSLTAPKWTKPTLCRAAGLPFDMVASVKTGTVDGWRAGVYSMRTVTNAVYTETNCVRSWFDATPYQYLNCGGSAGFPATVVETQTVVVTLDLFDCWDYCGTPDCEGCTYTKTVEMCDGQREVTLSGTNAVTLTAVCTNQVYAEGSTSIDYGWCGLRAVVTNLTAITAVASRTNLPSVGKNYYGNGAQGGWELYSDGLSLAESNYFENEGPAEGTRVEVWKTWWGYYYYWEISRAWGRCWLSSQLLPSKTTKQVDFYGCYELPALYFTLTPGVSTTMVRQLVASVTDTNAGSVVAGPIEFPKLDWPAEPCSGQCSARIAVGADHVIGPAVVRWEFDYR